MEPPREGHWFAEPAEVEEAHKHWWFLKSFFTLLVAFPCGLTCLSIGSAESLGTRIGTTALGLIGLLVWTAIRIRWRRASLRRHRKEDLAFIDQPLEEGEHPVEVAIFARGKGVGVDRGVLWLTDGLLHFHGSATSFALATQDVILRRVYVQNDPYEHFPEDAIRLKLGGKPSWIRITPLGREGK